MRQIIISTYIFDVKQITYYKKEMTIKGECLNVDSNIDSILKGPQQVSDNVGRNLEKWNVDSLRITSSEKHDYALIKMNQEKQ